MSNSKVKIEIDYESQTLDIIVDVYTKDDPYFYCFDRLYTTEGCLDCMAHISSKPWFVDGDKYELARKITEINKYMQKVSV